MQVISLLICFIIYEHIFKYIYIYILTIIMFLDKLYCEPHKLMSS